jgi:fibronectin type 3 domain-containing protein
LPSVARAQGPPAAPVNLAADFDGTRVRLTWDAGVGNNRNDPIFYRVYRDQQAVGTTFIRRFDDTQVEVGVEYVYVVAGVDSRGREGDPSDPLTFLVPDETPPTRPGGLTATGVSASQIDLEWSAATDTESQVAGYYVYRDGGAAPYDSTVSPGYSDTGLLAFTEHDYTVSAVNTSGIESEKSDPVSARTLDGTGPDAPADLSAVVVSSTAIALDWNAASDPETGVAFYYVYLDGDEEPFDSTTATNYTDDGISGDTERSYEVSAVNGDGLEGPRSAPASARTGDVTPPGAPSNVVAEATGARLIRLSWDAATDPETGISLYLVYRDAGESPIDSTTATTYDDDSVAPESTHSYEISARNGAGLEGPRSEPAEATTPAATDETPPSTPTDFSATATGPARVELSWTAAADPESGVAFYRVYRDGELLGTSPGGGFVDLTVEPTTSYEYEVAAVNGDGLEGARAGPLAVSTPDTRDTVPPAAPTNLRVASGG